LELEEVVDFGSEMGKPRMLALAEFGSDEEKEDAERNPSALDIINEDSKS
jgi:hypothetical protein